MNLDSNHVYGNRFVKVGDKGFNPALVTNFIRSANNEQVVIYFVDSAVKFHNTEAELVWRYLTDNSDDIVEPKQPTEIYIPSRYESEELPY